MNVQVAHSFFPGFPYKKENFELNDTNSTIETLIDQLSTKYKYDFRKITVRYIYEVENGKTKALMYSDMTTKISDLPQPGYFYLWITPNMMNSWAHSLDSIKNLS
jgi:hypothetical protein